jgi:hypothetical protein
MEFNQLGKIANKVNGKASAVENPAIIIAGPSIEPELKACTKDEPIIGPVQEKETKAKVNAMKNIPIKPPLSDWLSALFTHFEGILISNAPRNENANTMKIAKKIIFIYTLVESAFSADGSFETRVIINPSDTYIAMMEKP